MTHNGKKLVFVAAFLSLTLVACSSSTKETNVSSTPNMAAASANAMAKREAQEAQARAEAVQKAAQEAQAKAEAAQKTAQTAQNSGADAQTIAQAQAKAEEAKKEAEAAQARAEAAKKKAEEAEAKARKAEEDAAAERAKLEEAKKQTPEEIEKRAKADKIANGLVTSYFLNDNASQTAQILHDTNKRALLTQTIQAKSGKCNQTWGSGCTDENTQTGEVLFTESKSYAGYAVIRENYDKTNKQAAPVNSYIALVTTPTTDKAMVADATYTGTAVYTTKNLLNLTGYTDKVGYNAALTLTVKDSVVSGAITQTTGAKRTLVTLNDAVIQAGNNNVVFEGTATFNSRALTFTSSKDANGNYVDVPGTYKGQFAGNKAEQVVGTFESNSTAKETSIQGAFIGEKAP